MTERRRARNRSVARALLAALVVAGVGVAGVAPAAALTVPSPPRSLTGTAGPQVGKVTLKWTAPLDTGGGVATYLSEVSTDGGTTWSGYTDMKTQGLRKVVPCPAVYPAVCTFRISARNSAGTSGPSNVVTVPWTVPTAPQSLKVTSTNFSDASLTWKAPANTGGLNVSYDVKVKNASWATIATDLTVTSYFAPASCTSGTQCTYQVYAKNAIGTSVKGSNSVNIVPQPGPVENLAVAKTAEDLTVGNATSGRATFTITWGAPLTGLHDGPYQVQECAGYCDQFTKTWSSSFSVPNSTPTTDRTCAAGLGTCSYRVRSTNTRGGTGNWWYKAGLPSAPTGVTAVRGSSNTTIAVTYSGPAQPGANTTGAFYRFLVCATACGTAGNWSTSPTTAAYPAPVLPATTEVACPQAGAACTVRVEFVDGAGAASMPSASATVLPGAPAVTGVAPNAGPVSGGTTVTITGTDLTTATAVTFGGTAASAFTVDSATQITATAPAHAAGTVDVAVTTIGGTTAASAADQFTYVAAPAITALTPNGGALEGGTAVTITGTDLGGATAVSFGGVAASAFTVDSATQITATAPAHVAGVVDVAVTTIGGTSAVSTADRYTYAAAPGVTAVSPATGTTAGGTIVRITGSGFNGTTAVAFGTSAAPAFTVDSSTQITATAPAHAAGTVDVTVTATGGTSPTVAADQYTYYAGPWVDAVAPNAGPATGGTTVTITGTNLTGATAVTFGSVAASAFTVDSATQITATTPSNAPGTVDVVVTSPLGTSLTGPGDAFRFVAAPAVTGVAPNAGPVTGGNSVTISGSDFDAASAVTFGGVAASAFTVVSPAQITATAPAGSAGTVDVVVTAIGGTSTTSAADQYTYVNLPVVTALSPTAGPTTSGTAVTITGANLSGASAVRFGGTAATFTVNSATQITATAPAHVAGTVDVTVSTAGGTSATSAADQYTFVNAPTVTGVSPSSGPRTGGTVVTITGTNFAGTTSVKFGTTAATSFTVDSPTQITAVTSSHAAGAFHVRVTTAGGTSPLNGSADTFTFVNAPTVTAVAPASGAAAGGTVVTITGTNLTGATAVKFGTVAATTFTVDSATQITATAPAGAPGVVDVTVTTVGGTSATSAADQFTYL